MAKLSFRLMVGLGLAFSSSTLVWTAESGRNAPNETLVRNYPSRPVHLIVGFPPGGPTDITARIVAQWLSHRLGQQVVVENRPGAGGNVGTEALVRAAPDGYSLLLVTTSNAISAALYETPNFNFIRDVAPVAGISQYPIVMMINPSVPANTVAEFIAYARANPGKINMGSGSTGSPFHVAGELFKMMAGVDMVHVPYRGSALMLTGLLGGEVQVAFDSIQASIEHIRVGTLRALAVTTATRSPALPDIPTVSETIPGYQASGWNGIGVTRTTPTEIIDKLNKEVNATLSEAKMKAQFAELGATVLIHTPAQFGKLVADETEKWARVIRFAGIKP
jgi:tripartite-type tricarboxylate transporter receptor subunit TctC